MFPRREAWRFMIRVIGPEARRDARWAAGERGGVALRDRVSVESDSFDRIRVVRLDPSRSMGSELFHRIRVIRLDPSHSTGSESFDRIRVVRPNPSHSTESESFDRNVKTESESVE